MSDSAPQTTSYPDKLRTFRKNARTLSSMVPQGTEAFVQLHRTAVADGSLDTKTKELIALAISVVKQCDDCIAHHTHDALEAGATKEEIADALGVAVLMGGGPSYMYATHAIEALDQFSQARS